MRRTNASERVLEDTDRGNRDLPVLLAHPEPVALAAEEGRNMPGHILVTHWCLHKEGATVEITALSDPLHTYLCLVCTGLRIGTEKEKIRNEYFW